MGGVQDINKLPDDIQTLKALYVEVVSAQETKLALQKSKIISLREYRQRSEQEFRGKDKLITQKDNTIQILLEENTLP